MRVYADNAATTKLSPAAKEAMLPYFDEIYGNPSTLYTLGQEAAEHLLACRTEIAQLIGAADPREIVFTSGGSEADNQAIISAARNGARKGKKHLISTKFEHHAVLHTLDKLRDAAGCARKRRRPRRGRGRGHPGRHGARVRHVRQQRDRHHPAR